MVENKIFRCAVYTRKSTEEGLEQEFNSLQAQREACEAYIKSQKHEGWEIVDAEYDDGGISGGTMERPGLKRLLTDIQNRKVDIIVVYKVDRLTRSLSDFAKMIEILDANNASFVSVTQQFSTTSSMGRLTLNVLLSFAQFEHEVTGERIRDKIAASKKKGMWMGGPLPTGYEVKERKLLATKEKEVVQYIFQRYLELGCVRLLKQDLVQKTERKFSRGALYCILANPIYIGQIRHKDICYPGQHEAIIETELWNKVQDCLQNKTPARIKRNRKSEPSLLMGKLFDEDGKRLTPTSSTKDGRRYRYYISQELTTDSANHDSGWRLPAQEIEMTAIRTAQRILNDKAAITAELQKTKTPGYRITEILAAARNACSGNVIEFVQRIDLLKYGFRIAVSLPTGTETPPLVITQEIPMQIKRRGIEMRMVIEGSAPVAKREPALIKAVTQGYQWFEELVSGKAKTISEIAEREKIDDRDASRILNLALLAPDIVESILAGTQPVDMTRNSLLKRNKIPLKWEDQKFILGY